MDGDVLPAIVGESSDDELGWHVKETAADGAVEYGFDTDDELGYDDRYDARRGT